MLDILCHPSSTYHQSKAARPCIDISPKHGSKTAEQPDSKASNPWRQSGKAYFPSSAGPKQGSKGAMQQGRQSWQGREGRQGRQGRQGGQGGQGSKAGRQQGSKPPRQQGSKSMDLRFKLSRARPFRTNMSFSLGCRESHNGAQMVIQIRVSL